MPLQVHSQLSLNSYGDWERFVKTGREEMSLPSLRRKTQGTTCQSDSPQSLESDEENPPGKYLATPERHKGDQ